MKPYSNTQRILGSGCSPPSTRHAPRRGSEDLLRLGALHQALAKASPRDRRHRAEADPRAHPDQGAALEEWLPGHLKESPDLTLEEHCKAFEEETLTKVSDATMSRAIARLPGEWPLKKSPQ